MKLNTTKVKKQLKMITVTARKKTIAESVLNEFNNEYIMDGTDILEIIRRIKPNYGFRTASREDIIDFFLKSKLLNRERMTDNEGHEYPYYYSPKQKVDIFDFAAKRSRASYFSFYSALFINNLTLQVPKRLYLTNERSHLILNTNNSLTQSNIDNAFAKPARISNNVRNFKGNTITLINGQYQERTGVVTYRNNYRVTDIERSLIDSTMRPFYSGGVTQVLEAYENAREQMDRDKFISYFENMNFIYPYHQSIGFYLEKAKYEEDIIEYFAAKDKKYTFYLSYNIHKTVYSEKWNLIYPLGL